MCQQVLGDIFTLLSQNCPSLHSIRLDFTNSSIMDSGFDFIAAQLGNIKSLTSIDLDFTINPIQRCFHIFSHLEKLPSLESLSLVIRKNYLKISPEDLAANLAFKNLKKFRFEFDNYVYLDQNQMAQISKQLFSQFFSARPGLEQFKLAMPFPPVLPIVNQQIGSNTVLQVLFLEFQGQRIYLTQIMELLTQIQHFTQI